ncbi:STAS domain-containing protein [Sphaerisporangium corydalis]|uniref:Anti-sigma factor antagonist n=1 Tax=Sphaerisporangium corydalis TaxID=1441875 RepID=A0ABV9E8I8_9ACTN|nr:STAS domain-containing protein [Sphaerisporangium corydalis]
MPLTVRRDHRHEFTVISIIGEVDTNGASRLGENIDEALRDTRPQLLFDLSRMDFIDSAGLRLLVRACDDAQRCGGTCALCCLRPSPRKIMDLTGIGTAFDIYPTMAAALAGGPLESPASRKLS